MHFDTDKRKWVDGEYTEMEQHLTLHSLASAKKLIKLNRDKYVSSCITQTWSDGSWENLGEIKLKGSNKTFDYDTNDYIVIDRSTPHSHKWCTGFLKRSGYNLKWKGATSHWDGVWSTTEGVTAYIVKTNNK